VKHKDIEIAAPGGVQEVQHMMASRHAAAAYLHITWRMREEVQLDRFHTALARRLNKVHPEILVLGTYFQSALVQLARRRHDYTSSYWQLLA
jgi:hypothetical protein